MQELRQSESEQMVCYLYAQISSQKKPFSTMSSFVTIFYNFLHTLLFNLTTVLLTFHNND